MPTEDEFDRWNKSVRGEIRNDACPDNELYKCNPCNEMFTQSQRDKENGCSWCGGVLTKI